MTKPLVAITLGDPGGIGPEVVARALSMPEVRSSLIPLVLGERTLLDAVATQLDLNVRFVEGHPDKAPTDRAEVSVWNPCDQMEDPVIGRIAAGNARAAYRWIVEATALARNGQVEAICTAPISKEAMFEAGYTFPGHTELLAQQCGSCPVRMMLEGGGLSVVLQTIHVPLTAVPGLLTKASILETISIAGSWARGFRGEKSGRIAVCGLNPHAGEGGHFGREEIDVIRPAIDAAVAAGFNVQGPFPADTVFFRMLQGDFDLVVAMYHDQALIPVKTLDFHGGVNVTIGLPIIRTSPDHGTAFAIAGKGAASEKSMMNALLRAADLAVRKRGTKPQEE